MTTVVIAEKPSQARDLKAALGSSFGVILAAEGHLLTLAEPEDVNPAWKTWSAEVLKPNGLYPFKPGSGGNKAEKLKAIKAALKGATKVVIATDCDREGQLIGQEILEYCKYKGTVERAIFTAQDPLTLQNAFKALKPNSEYQNMYQAAVARQQADQIFNLSLTRAATVTLQAPGTRGVIGVGRVKTPTLAIVCRRELEILNFKPVDYFEIHATALVKDGSFVMKHAPNERILDRKIAEEIQKVAEGAKGPLVVKVEDKKRSPPKLFDLPALQKSCASKFGWTANKTLEIAQELYDGDGKKIITYPRAESRYLAEAQAKDVPTILSGLGKLSDYKTFVTGTPVIRTGKSGVFSDKALAGVSHHAIIPNVNVISDATKILAKCSEDEKKMFDLIARAYMAAMMPDYLYKQTTATLIVAAKFDFVAKGQVPLQLGWRLVYQDQEKEEAKKPKTESKEAKEKDEPEDDEEGATTLPPLTNGEMAKLKDAKLMALQTKPPPRYNEGGLIAAMQDAWKFVEDPTTRDRLKEAKGIGTPATRANILEGLKRQQFLKTSGKNIVPTESGLALYQVLAAAAPPVVDPATTAMWEFKLDEILLGQLASLQVIDEIAGAAGKLITQIQAHAAKGGALISGASKGGGKPTAKMVEFAKKLAEMKGVKLPKGLASDSNICRTFLDTHATKREEGAAPGKPSEKSVAFAKQIAQSLGADIPEAAMRNQKSLSEWINANKDKANSSTKSSSKSSAQSVPAKSTNSADNSAGNSTANSANNKFDKTATDKGCPKCGKTKLSILKTKDGTGQPFYACESKTCGFYLTVGLRKRGANCPKCQGLVFERKAKDGSTFWRCVHAPTCDFRASVEVIAKPS